jgi:hypothetical protein
MLVITELMSTNIFLGTTICLSNYSSAYVVYPQLIFSWQL